MIAVDTNILIYAHRRDSPFYEPAARVVRDLAQSNAAWSIPWPCVHEFYSVATHARIYDPPSRPDQAITQVEAWLGSPSLVLLHEGATYWPTLRAMLESGKVQGPMVHDARIAALCRANGVRELWSADRDFGRFPDLTVRNPLVVGGR
ncbi:MULTISPECIES: TA system VapC family ribonuclease toxin [unclassified Pseudofrankia]|uniref:type II toxin-antitoxin system VapC family toxin n=1 Tax=unclassified Pseudofrankia TaxID=2994372 RepID=UPI0008DAF47C|nr:MULTISPECIES: TA system VapC family ribonuclease toxin [unclassified Pseudofrankia]MDT3444387.1 PIN domain-containing protein [Pseudofrankia sp. BMG5.37]